MCMYVCVCMYECMNVCVYEYIHVCMYVCIYCATTGKGCPEACQRLEITC